MKIRTQNILSSVLTSKFQ